MIGTMDFEEHDALVRRLKVLSKTQTAFLKLYLHGKLVAAKLIGMCTDALPLALPMPPYYRLPRH